MGRGEKACKLHYLTEDCNKNLLNSITLLKLGFTESQNHVNPIA